MGVLGHRPLRRVVRLTVAKSVRVTSAQVKAAQSLVRDAGEAGELVSPTLLKIANAQPRTRLSDLRRARGMTQAQVAQTMRVSQQRVSEFERRDIRHVGAQTLRRYIEALGGRLAIAIDFDDGTHIEA